MTVRLGTALVALTRFLESSPACEALNPNYLTGMIDVELAEQEASRPRCILHMDDAKRCSPHSVAVGVELFEALEILEFLGCDSDMSFTRACRGYVGVVSDIVDHQHSTVWEAIICPFDFPFDFCVLPSFSARFYVFLAKPWRRAPCAVSVNPVRGLATL